MKICVLCEESKNLSSFGNYKRSKDGHRNECKSCQKKQNIIYYRTKIGVITKIYHDQKTSSKRRGHHMPSYSKQWLYDWIIMLPEFHRLYDIWVLSGYTKDTKPSIDRIDDNIGYTEYNIQIMSWKDNNNKGRESKKNKTPNVLQYSKDMIFINKFICVSEASKDSGVNVGGIYLCCERKRKTAGGFKWRYSDE